MWIVIPIALTAAAFRFGPSWAGLVAMALTLVLSGLAAFQQRQHPHRGAAVALALAAGLAGIGLVPSWWPCEVACQSGAEYQTLFDQPILLMATAAYTLIAVAVALAPSKLTALGLWGSIGTSVYFLALSYRLEMVCGHCLAVHTAVLTTAAFAMRPPLRLGWIVPLGVIAAAATGLALGYQADLERASAPVPQGPAAGGDQSASQVESTDTSGDTDPSSVDDPLGGLRPSAAVARGRQMGPDSAPLRIELVGSYLCAHCSEELPTILETLRPIAEQGTVQVVPRLTFNRKKPASRELVQLTLAAAALGRWQEFVTASFTACRPSEEELSGPGRFRAGLARVGQEEQIAISRLAENGELDDVRALLAAAPDEFNRLFTAEQGQLDHLKAQGKLPQVHLVDPETNTVHQSFRGHFAGAELLSAIERLSKR